MLSFHSKSVWKCKKQSCGANWLATLLTSAQVSASAPSTVIFIISCARNLSWRRLYYDHLWQRLQHVGRCPTRATRDTLNHVQSWCWTVVVNNDSMSLMDTFHLGVPCPTHKIRRSQTLRCLQALIARSIPRDAKDNVLSREWKRLFGFLLYFRLSTF